MGQNGKRLTIIVSLVLIVILFFYYYVFNIYETTVETWPKNLFADNSSTVNISINPVNAFGFKIPFRKIYGSFEITGGKHLVDIVKEDDINGILTLRAKNKVGKVIIYVKSKYSFLPSLVEINIYPNTA